MFEPGTLRQRIQHTTARALASGALLPIESDLEFVEDRGVRFLVRSVRSPARQEARPAAGAVSGQAANPFLPYDPALHVADASPTHVCLLNKYNVVDNHLLIVTRQFQPQQSPLTADDFSALWRCLAEYDSLGFYNAGRVAGASQAHKHLQLVPLPLAPSGRRVPLDPCLIPPPGHGHKVGSAWPPFRHAATRFTLDMTASWADAADESVRCCERLLKLLGMDFDSSPPPAYNLLLTREWMLLVPREHECFQSISLNALAFAGALLVREEQQRRLLEEQGPMSALIHAAGPSASRPASTPEGID